MDGAAREGIIEVEEVSDDEVPLVRKRRRLVRAGETVPARENMAAEEASSTRDVANQRDRETGGGKGTMVPEASRSGDGGEGRQALPLVVVPFEPVREEEPAVRRKQVTKAKRLQALTVAYDMLCAAPGKLGMIEKEGGELSAVGAGRSEEKVSEVAQPYVPNWPQVTMGSSLSTTDEKKEWLLNCLPPNILEGYKELGTGSVIGLGVQSVLLVRVLYREKE